MFGIDRDAEAVAHCRPISDVRLKVVLTKFSQMSAVLSKDKLVDGVLFDFGVSSHQIDIGERGFSYRFDGPLDLRMNQREGSPFNETLAGLTEEQIGHILRDFGEESQWKRIARAIRQRLELGPLLTTFELAAVINAAVPATRIKSLSRVFQGFRIFVNDELSEIKQGLAAGFSRLRPGGRLVAISYHSLEDRIVKEFMRGLVQPPTDPRDPFATSKSLAIDLTRKPVLPGEDELKRNPRARSAKLRAIERI